MSHVIEYAKSGRAKCKKCKEKIEKDEIRFGHETSNAFSDSAIGWYHMKCAAQKVPIDLEKTLKETDLEVPDLDEIKDLIAKNRKKQKPTTYPYAEEASTGRSSCIVCGDQIAKGTLRVAIEREVDAGGMTRMTAGYLHPGCASECEDAPDDLAEGIEENSISLDEDQLKEVLSQL